MSQQNLCSENCRSDVLKHEDIKVETPGVLWNSPLFSAELLDIAVALWVVLDHLA